MPIAHKGGVVAQQGTRFITITGGVCSSIGKGVLVSSIGVLLKNAGYSIAVVKWDPYLNVDPGTMSPLEHGEVFVTADGAETDLDLGHYERMMQLNLTRESSLSAGQIFEEVLVGERTGSYLGRCIQFVPHVVDAIKNRLFDFAILHKTDFVLIEIGGTIGDMESIVFLEAFRQIRLMLPINRLLHCHLSLVPYLPWTQEIKTKPTQHSVHTLKAAGIIPDYIFLRTEQSIDTKTRNKLSIMCGVPPQSIFQVFTHNPIYEIFIDLNRQGLSKHIQQFFAFETIKETNLKPWQQLIAAIEESKKTVAIGLIAKYVGSNDPYISVIEAIKCAGYWHNTMVEIIIIDAQHIEKETRPLDCLDGIVVPGGFDKRGIEGKIIAANLARTHNIPYLGLCLGMQIMLIEFARSVLGLHDANSTEFDQHTQYPVISLLAEQEGIERKGATMRLGTYPCTIKRGTRAHQAYGLELIYERHRHRYECNNAFKNDFEAAGMIFSGIYQEKNLIEIAEIQNHPFMLGTQAHPEFTSWPLNVNPLFMAFMKAVIANKK